MDAPPVPAVYDRIADHFSDTRAHPWPDVESFLADRDRVPVGVDVGCGNGRHATLLADHADRVVGVDASGELLGIARDRAGESGYGERFAPVRGDAGALPLAADAAGLGLYVATLHHLRPRARRVASLDEFARVLAPDGAALVSVWSVAHDRFDADGAFDTTVDWTLPGGETLARYYHVYDADEFRADLDASACEVVDRFDAAGNCYAVVRGSSGRGDHTPVEGL